MRNAATTAVLWYVLSYEYKYYTTRMYERGGFTVWVCVGSAVRVQVQVLLHRITPMVSSHHNLVTAVGMCTYKDVTQGTSIHTCILVQQQYRSSVCIDARVPVSRCNKHAQTLLDGVPRAQSTKQNTSGGIRSLSSHPLDLKLSLELALRSMLPC